MCIQTIAEWETVYLIASVIHFMGVTFYAIFASGEQQSWAEPTDDDDKNAGDTAQDKVIPPPASKASIYGTAAEDTGPGLYPTSLELVQRPAVDHTYVMSSNGSTSGK